MTYNEFRRTYLWGNCGLYKNEPTRLIYRLRRNAQLLLNLDENLKFLEFNAKFNLRLNVNRADTYLLDENWINEPELILRLRSNILWGMQSLRECRK